MAAIDFPNAPTDGQIFESGGMSWTYQAGVGWVLNAGEADAGSGFSFISDTKPVPLAVGDTWFDSSTGATGGTSWVAINEGPIGGSEIVWVQFSSAGLITNREVLAGVIQDYIGYTAPPGWITMEGQTIANANTIYPFLWQVVPAVMKSGTSLIVPDTRSRITAGYNVSDANFNTIGKIGGAATVTLGQAEMPVHSHVGPSHQHTGPAHQHGIYSGVVPGGSLYGSVVSGPTSAPSPDVQTTQAGTGLTGAAGNTATGNAGSGGAHNNLQPYITFLKIMRAY